MKFQKFLIAASLSVCAATSQAATVFTATDGTVDFLFPTFDSSLTLAMFDDNDDGSWANALNIAFSTSTSSIVIGGPVNGSDYTATNSNLDSIYLTGGKDFVLGLSDDNGASWTGGFISACYSPSVCNVTFNMSSGIELVLQVDAVPSSVVPVPAALWLFGSGLIGLAGISRRRNP